MSTFNQLVATVSSEDLRDSANKTFTTGAVGDMINAGLAELGRIAPDRFQEDITPTADTLSYQIRNGEPEIELNRVELWDSTTTPMKYLAQLRAESGEYVSASAAGWRIWDGRLELSSAQELFIDPDSHIIRVWGYGPYEPVTGDTAMPVSRELEYAIRVYCRKEALARLSIERDLYSQWQTRSGNRDVTPAGLLSALSEARDEWRRLSRAIFVLRETR